MGSSPPIPDDTRGIVDPEAMLRTVDFARYRPGAALEGLVDWFWAVAWELPEGAEHDQQIVNHPCGHLSIGTLDDRGTPLDPPEGRFYGPPTGLGRRRLTEQGWTVAAKISAGALAVFLDRPARDGVDRQLGIDRAVPGLDGRALERSVVSAATNDDRVEILRSALVDLVADRCPDRVAEGRRVAALAARAEHDRSIRRIDDLARLAGIGTRTLQRLFDLHVGVSPSFLIRRWRIIEAAEQGARSEGHWPGWATVAAQLGYADQAHLTRDFVRHLGCPPSEYRHRQERP